MLAVCRHLPLCIELSGSFISITHWPTYSRKLITWPCCFKIPWKLPEETTTDEYTIYLVLITFLFSSGGWSFPTQCSNFWVQGLAKEWNGPRGVWWCDKSGFLVFSSQTHHTSESRSMIARLLDPWNARWGLRPEVWTNFELRQSLRTTELSGSCGSDPHALVARRAVSGDSSCKIDCCTCQLFYLWLWKFSYRCLEGYWDIRERWKWCGKIYRKSLRCRCYTTLRGNIESLSRSQTFCRGFTITLNRIKKTFVKRSDFWFISLGIR